MGASSGRVAKGAGAAALVAVAVALSACGGGNPSASGGQGSPTTHGGSDTSHSSTTTSLTAPRTTEPVLSAGQVGSRASVPWSKIGAGWLLATWSSSTSVASGSVTGTPPSTIYLVDPEGGRYSLGPGPTTGVLTDWSGNGADALFLVPTTPAATGTINFGAVVVDLRSGATSQFSVGASVGQDAIQFSKPDGTAIVVTGPQDRRYSLTGTLEESYPTSVPGATGSTTTGSTTTGGAFAETPTGTELAVPASGGIDVMTNGGKALRYIGPPPGLQSCTLDGLWEATSVLESCGSELWTQPLSGGVANRLATAATGPVLIDGWMVGTRVVAEAGACGTTWLETASPGGTLATISVPDVSSGGSVEPVGARGTQLGVVLRPGCDAGTAQQQDTTLAWYDPATNAVTALLGSLAGGGTVDAAVLFHGPSADGGTQG